MFALINARAESSLPGASGARSFVGVSVMNARAQTRPPATLELGSLVWHGDTKATVARAILESLAFAARANADQISELAPIARVTACGGLTKSTLYIALLAALLERTITVPRWREGSGVGAAICAGLGAGVFTSLVEGQRALVSVDLEVEPDPVLVDAYSELYATWLRDYTTLAARN